MKKIAVLVSGGGTNLQALITAQTSGVLSSGFIGLVLSSSPSAFALQRAQQAKIPTVVLSPSSFSDSAKYDSALTAELLSQKIDIVVLAGFLFIVGAHMLHAFPNRIINVHPSLLPAFGGKGMYGIHVHEAVIAQKETVSGATVHYVNSKIDDGQIIMQKQVPVLHNDTPATLQKRVMEEAEWILLPQAVERLCQTNY